MKQEIRIYNFDTGELMHYATLEDFVLAFNEWDAHNSIGVYEDGVLQYGDSVTKHD